MEIELESLLFSSSAFFAFLLTNRRAVCAFAPPLRRATPTEVTPDVRYLNHVCLLFHRLNFQHANFLS